MCPLMARCISHVRPNLSCIPPLIAKPLISFISASMHVRSPPIAAFMSAVSPLASWAFSSISRLMARSPNSSRICTLTPAVCLNFMAASSGEASRARAFLATSSSWNRAAIRSVCLAAAAYINAVRPSLSFSFGFAPMTINASAVETCPSVEAVINAVRPSASLSLTSTPSASSLRIAPI